MQACAPPLILVRGDRLHEVKNSSRQSSSPRGWNSASTASAGGAAHWGSRLGRTVAWRRKRETGLPVLPHLGQTCCSCTGFRQAVLPILDRRSTWGHGRPPHPSPLTRPRPQSHAHPQLRVGSAGGDGRHSSPVLTQPLPPSHHTGRTSLGRPWPASPP